MVGREHAEHTQPPLPEPRTGKGAGLQTAIGFLTGRRLRHLPRMKAALRRRFAQPGPLAGSRLVVALGTLYLVLLRA